MKYFNLIIYNPKLYRCEIYDIFIKFYIKIYFFLSIYSCHKLGINQKFIINLFSIKYKLRIFFNLKSKERKKIIF